MTNSLKVLFSLSFLFLYFIGWTQNNDTIFENQLYVKLKSLDNISKTSWKAVENSPNNINSSVFPFGGFLDSIGLINIKQPFGKKKNAEKLYLTFLLEFTDKKHDLNKIIKDLSKFSEVDYSEPKFKDFEDYIPNDPSYSSCWHLNKIQANLAWDLGTGNSSITVAIVDDAVQRTHPDLTNMIWNNLLEIPNNGIDDDNNGYVDDYNGWDVADNDNNTNPPNTNLDHGTHVAGIAGAHTNNNIGISSIGYGISIIPIKATRDNNLNGTINNAYDGVYYAAINNADIINCSWGSSFYSQTNNNIIQSAINNGSIIVASAGNSNVNLGSIPRYPSCYNGVICVANTTQSDIKRSSSCYGTRVDISAPGTSILSTVPFSQYDTKTGTSMSAPMVAGLLGLMKSFSPSTSNEQLIDCMKSSCDNIDALNPSYAGLLGSGRINAYQALLCLSPPVADFLIRVEDSCSGEIQFSDATLGIPNSWAWDFESDGIIDDTTRSATRYFNQSGSYNTTLTVSNSFGSDSKTIYNAFNITLSDAPSIQDMYTCEGDSVFFKTNLYSNLNWYINENDFDEIYSGEELITEPIFNDTSFFVSELSDTSCYSTGLNFFPINGSTSSNYSYLLFDVYQKMTLKSVDVKATGNQDRIIVILDSSNQVIFEKTFNNFNTGINTLELNTTLFPGNNYKIGLSPNSPVNLFRANSGANFPYEIPGLISITKSVINPINTSTQQYYYFFNWQVCDALCESKRTEVKIYTDDCENIQDLQDIVVFPNPNSGIFTVRVPKNKSGTLKVVNMLGQTVYENSFSAIVERVFVNIPSLSKGLYNLSVVINDKMVVKKFTIGG
jgi:subtilisin family serine protease